MNLYIFNFKNKDMFCFVKKLLLFVLLCLGTLYLLSQLYKSLNKDNSDVTLKFRTIPEQIEICNLGNSHGLYGFCYDNITDYTCFNFGLVSQSLDYDYRLLQEYKDNLAEGGLMFITVSYTSLYGNDESEREDFISKNKRYYKILSPEHIKNYSLRQDLTINILPVMWTADNVLYDIATSEERGRLVMDMWEWTLQDKSMESIIEDATTTYARHFEGRVDAEGNWVINQNNVDALYNIITLCRKKNIEPVIVTTPYLNEYTDEIRENQPSFFDEFYGFLKKVQEDTGVDYFDFSCDLRFINEYDYFFSVDHLNRIGALELTEILLERCGK